MGRWKGRSAGQKVKSVRREGGKGWTEGVLVRTKEKFEEWEKRGRKRGGWKVRSPRRKREKGGKEEKK